MNTPFGAVIVGAAICGLVTERELLRGHPSIRPAIVDMVDDFAFASTPNSLHVLDAPSPAAALAIAQRIADEADRTLDRSSLRPVNHASRPSAHR